MNADRRNEGGRRAPGMRSPAATRRSSIVVRAVIVLAVASHLVATGSGSKAQTVEDPGLTRQVSVGPEGADSNGTSRDPAISADGRWVAFESTATNLDPSTPDSNGVADVFVFDRVTRATKRISVPASGAPACPSTCSGRGSYEPDISDDGRVVAFTSTVRLVPEDLNDDVDVYVYTMPNGPVRLVTSDPGSGSVGSVGSAAVAKASKSAAEPTFSVSKTASPSTRPEPGGSFAYTVAITPAPGYSVRIQTITDDVYGNLATRPGSTCGALIGDEVFDGETARCAFTGDFTGDAGASLTDVVTVTGAVEVIFSVEPTVVIPPTVVTVSDSETVTITNAAPTIEVSREPYPAFRPEPGGTFLFVVTVKNTSASTDPVTIQSITDSVYGNLATRPGSTCGALIGKTLAPGATSAPCTFTAEFTGALGASQSGTVTVTAVDDENSTVTGSDQATTSIHGPPPPAFDVQKTVTPVSRPEPGGPFTFTVQITNQHAFNLGVTTITDDVYGDLATRPGSTCGSVLSGPIEAGATVTCTFPGSFTGGPGATETDVVTVTAFSFFNSERNFDRDAATVSITPGLTVSKTASPLSRPEPGGTFTFTVAVTNNGPDEFRFTTITDDKYGDLATRPGSTCGALIGTTLAPGATSPPCTFTGDFTGPAGAQQTDVVTVTGTGFNATPRSGAGTATVSITGVAPSIEVTKTANPLSRPAPGGSFTFAVTVRNTSGPADPVTIQSITDDIYGNVATRPGSTCGALIGTTLAPGASSAPCTFTGDFTGSQGSTETDTVTVRALDDEGTQASDSDDATVSLTCGGACGGSSPSISGDGNAVAFVSVWPYGYGSLTGESNPNVFLRDLRDPAARPRLISQRLTASGPPLPGSGVSAQPSVNRDGTFVAFTSLAPDLVAADPNGPAPSVFRRSVDLSQPPTAAGGTTILIAPESGVNHLALDPSISGDGNRVAFVLQGPLPPADVYVRQVEPSRLDRVSERLPCTSPPCASTDALNPDISADGSTVGFESASPDLVPGDTNNDFDVFVRDMFAPVRPIERISTTLTASANPLFRALNASVSEDGSYVAFDAVEFIRVDAGGPVAPNRAPQPGPEVVVSTATTRGGANGTPLVVDIPSVPPLGFEASRDVFVRQRYATPVLQSVNFGNVVVNDSRDQTIILRNDGPGPLVVPASGAVTFFGATDFQVVGGTCPGSTLRRGDSCTLLVRFHPLRAGPQAGTLQVNSTSGGAPRSVVASVQGTGTPPPFTVAPDPVDFGPVDIGTSAEQTVTIRNDSTVPQPAAILRIEGAHAGDFQIKPGSDTCVPPGLAVRVPTFHGGFPFLRPGETCQVTVVFTPTAEGPRSAELVGWFGAENVPFRVPLVGTGVVPFTVSPNPVAWDPVLLDGPGESKPITITNEGSVPLVITSVTLADPDFTLALGTCGPLPKTLAPGESCAVTVTFDPTAIGPQTAELTVQSTTSTESVALSGTGYTQSITPLAVDFGPVGVGVTSPPQLITITKAGTGPFTVGVSTITGPNAGDFRIISNTCTSPVSSGASCQIGVVFTPAAPGSRVAALGGTIDGAPFSVPLTGTGVPGVLAVSPNPVLWDPVKLGDPGVAKPIKVTNNGPGYVTLTGLAFIGGSDFTIGQNTCGPFPKTLAPGQSCEITVTFKPTGTSNAQGLLTLGSSVGDILVPLQGAVTGIPVVVSPSPLDFGPVNVDKTSPEQSLTIKIEGLVATPNGAFTIGGPHAGDFQQTTRECVATNQPTAASTCTVKLTFRPTATGARTATISGTFSPFNVPFTADLKGTGVVPEIAPNPVDFGSVVVNTTSGEKVVTVTNKGAGDIVPGPASVGDANAGDFAIVADECNGKTLAKDASCTVKLTFTPTDVAGRTSALTVENVGQVVLQGTGLNPPPPTTTTTTTTPGSTTTTGPTTPPTTPTSVPGPAPTTPTTAPFGTTTTTQPPNIPTTTVPGDQPPPPPPGVPSIRLSRPLGSPGSVTQVEGSGFRPNTTVQLRWTTQQGVSIPVATVTTDANGSFTGVAALVFSSDPSGARTMEANGGPDQLASASYLVVPATVQPSGNEALSIRRTQLLHRR